MRYLPSRYTIATLLAPFALGVLLAVALGYTCYAYGVAVGRSALRDDLRVQRALVNSYAAHDVVDDQTIADITRERNALRKDFDDLEVSFSE